MIDSLHFSFQLFYKAALAAFEAVNVVFVRIIGADFDQLGFIIAALLAVMVMDSQKVLTVSNFNFFSRIQIFNDEDFLFLIKFRLSMALRAAHPFAIAGFLRHQQASTGFTEHFWLE